MPNYMKVLSDHHPTAEATCNGNPEVYADIEFITAPITQATLDADALVTPVPQSVTPRQLRLALVGAGTDLATIDAGIAALPEPDKTAAQVSWEYSTEMHRSNPLLIALAPSLGFTETDLDNLFISAATL